MRGDLAALIARGVPAHRARLGTSWASGQRALRTVFGLVSSMKEIERESYADFLDSWSDVELAELRDDALPTLVSGEGARVSRLVYGLLNELPFRVFSAAAWNTYATHFNIN